MKKEDAILAITLLNFILLIFILGVSIYKLGYFDGKVNKVEKKINTISELLKLDDVELIEIEE